MPPRTRLSPIRAGSCGSGLGWDRASAFDWVTSDWLTLDWVTLDWVSLDWVTLDWVTSGCATCGRVSSRCAVGQVSFGRAV